MALVQVRKVVTMDGRSLCNTTGKFDLTIPLALAEKALARASPLHSIPKGITL
jgi:hypothetical protein